MNVDEEGDLRAKHEIASYPTLLLLHDDEDGNVVSSAFSGDSTSSGRIVSHVAAVVSGLAMLDTKADATAFAGLIGKVDELIGAKEERWPESAVLVVGTFSAPSKMATYTALSEKVVGDNRFMAATANPDLASTLLKAVSGDKKVKAKKDMVYVYTKENGVLSLKLPSNDDEYVGGGCVGGG